MNPRLAALQPYPFERLRGLLAGVQPAPLAPIRLTVGEPQHPTPSVVREALASHLDGLAHYPLTTGSDRLREAIARWFIRRFGLERLDANTEVLPVNGSREALFAFAQCVVGRSSAPLVACPNPFYQIYEGGALLAGGEPVFLNQCRADGFTLNTHDLSPEQWSRVDLLYVRSPGNPTGRVLRQDEWEEIFALADRHGFVIASDECYSEVYFDEMTPPLGVLQAARISGRSDYRSIVAFTSLSKRSNAPGLRSGAVAGDARILSEFLRYRTYHGCAMNPAVQEASIAAWADESHVRENRALYRAKFDAVVPLLAPVVDAPRPDGGFYLWARVPDAWRGDDERFTADLVARANVLVLPGRYLGRDAGGINPGAGYVRIALVPSLDECFAAAHRIVAVCTGGGPEGPPLRSSPVSGDHVNASA